MSDDGRSIIAQGGAGHALIVTFDLKSGKSLRRFRLSEEGIRSSKFSKDAKLIVTKDYKDTIKVWSGATGKNIQTINGRISRVYDFALSQDGKLIALAGDPSLKILELPTGKLIREMPKEASRSIQVAFSSDAKSIAGVGSFHGVETIGIWSTVTGDKEATLETGATDLGVGSLLFAPDGRWIAGTTDGGFIQMWNRSSGRLSVRMYGVGDRNWLTTAPGAFFKGSAGSERLLNLTKGTERLPNDTLSHRFKRPDLVEQFLEGDPRGEYQQALSSAKTAITDLFTSTPVSEKNRAASGSVPSIDGAAGPNRTPSAERLSTEPQDQQKR